LNVKHWKERQSTMRAPALAIIVALARSTAVLHPVCAEPVAVSTNQYEAALTGAASEAAEAGDDIDKNIAVLKNCKTADAETLIAAAETLGEKGPAAVKAVPVLIAGFRNPPAVRQAAIKALARIGAEAVPPLIEVMRVTGSKMTMEQGIRRDAVVCSIEVLQRLDPMAVK